MTTRRRIFLAHARDDKPQVRKLYADLKARGFDPWLDAIDLMPGQVWKTEIPKAIREAEIFLACLSTRSVEKRGYVQREFRLALSAFAERPPGSIYLIPVRLDECHAPDLAVPDLELNLRDIQWVDLWEQDGFDRLVAAIEHVLGKQVYSQPPPGAVLRDAPWCPELVVIPSGTFVMGSPEAEEGRLSDEGPLHVVRFAFRIAIGRYLVTFEEYDQFAEATRRQLPYDQGWGRNRRPVVNVSWNNAQAYVAWLTDKTGQPYRLLSEAEWEYACRAGMSTRYSWGNEITPECANYARSAFRQTTEVDKYSPNPWGLYDMHGNVWEWVEDCRNNTYEAAPDDGSAWTTGDCDLRVVRGGSWDVSPNVLRAAQRNQASTSARACDRGFRVARTL